jgi:8-amino-7-oxononanoate synthase
MPYGLLGRELMSDFDEYWRRCLDELEKNGRRRRLRDFDRLADGRVDAGGGPLIDFSSNDYLGLSHHPELILRARAYAARWGAGAAASRLVSGNLPPTSGIEEKIARGKGTEAALLFVSGVQANITLLPALLDARVLGGEPLVYADRLNHASLIQGCAAAGVRQIRFRHNDLGHLKELLERQKNDERPRVIVTETVFSMDGDRTDVPALAALADEYGAFLYLDEAHATGVLGQDGFGLAHGLRHGLTMGTFSKGLGAFGAYAACSHRLRDYLINRCGGIIYATALPPAALGAIDAALDLLPGLNAERIRLAAHGERFRAALAEAGLNTGTSSTQIVPLILGSVDQAVGMARRLEAEGLLGVAIRPPTVPVGGSRIRFTFSALHSDDQRERLIETVIRLSKNS